MRTILIALLMTLATQVGADTKKYGKKECNDISAVIDFLLSTTPNLWVDLEKNPYDFKVSCNHNYPQAFAGKL